jgi:hypothetical protein
VEIRGSDLAFTPEETAELLNGAMGLDLRADALAVLQARTELALTAELATDLRAWTILTDVLGFGAQVALVQGRTEDAEALARPRPSRLVPTT